MLKTDLELIDSIKKDNDSNSFIELSNRHTPLCHSIYNKYSSSITASGISLDDVKENKDIVVFQSIMSYDPNKNVKFSTWLGNNIRFQCLNAINSNGKYICMEEKDLIRIHDETYTTENSEKVNKNNLEYILSILNQLKDERIIKIFSMRYLSGNKKTSWSIIAKELGVSVQTAINIHKKGIKMLKTKLVTLNIFDKI